MIDTSTMIYEWLKTFKKDVEYSYNCHIKVDNRYTIGVDGVRITIVDIPRYNINLAYCSDLLWFRTKSRIKRPGEIEPKKPEKYDMPSKLVVYLHDPDAFAKIIKFLN